MKSKQRVEVLRIGERKLVGNPMAARGDSEGENESLAV